MKVTNKSTLIEKLCDRKRLPREFLSRFCREDGSKLVIPYRAEDGSPCRPRLRLGEAGGDSRWRGKGSALPIVPYGLERLVDARRAGYLLIVEGESDCWAAWLHGRPCLGLPGNRMAGKLHAAHVREIATVFIWQEPGTGGETFVRDTVRRLAALKFVGRVLVITPPDGQKDLSDLQADDPLRFNQRLDESLKLAVEPRVLPTEPAVEATAAAPPRRGSVENGPTAKRPASSPSANDLKAQRELLDLRAWIVRATGEPADRSGKFCSPFNAGKRTLSVTRDGQHWTCWASGKGGDIIDLVMLTEGLDFAAACLQLGIVLKGSHPKGEARKGLAASGVRISPSPESPSDNSDKRPADHLPNFHELAGHTRCQHPLPGYFEGANPHNQHRCMVGLHRCGSCDCEGCHNAWCCDRLSQFVQRAHEDAEPPVLESHHATFGGSYYAADIDAERLATVTRWLNRQKKHNGRDPESVQYLAVQHADDPARVTLLATVQFDGSRELSLPDAERLIGKRILSITPDLRRNRNRPITNSRGWGREKVSEWKLAGRPSGREQLESTRLEVRRLAEKNEVKNVRDFVMQNQFRMTAWEVPPNFDREGFMLRCGIMPTRLAKLASVMRWGANDEQNIGESAPCIQPQGPPDTTRCEHQYRDEPSPRGNRRACAKCGKLYGYLRQPQPAPVGTLGRRSDHRDRTSDTTTTPHTGLTTCH